MAGQYARGRNSDARALGHVRVSRIKDSQKMSLDECRTFRREEAHDIGHGEKMGLGQEKRIRSLPVERVLNSQRQDTRRDLDVIRRYNVAPIAHGELVGLAEDQRVNRMAVGGIGNEERIDLRERDLVRGERMPRIARGQDIVLDKRRRVGNLGASSGA